MNTVYVLGSDPAVIGSVIHQNQHLGHFAAANADKTPVAIAARLGTIVVEGDPNINRMSVQEPRRTDPSSRQREEGRHGTDDDG